ncbi:MAG: LLM class flavin-dependent oxidoreductase, partial [Acidobacteria bacterium]|nr:LLM class flavin-dependent oxidoreductase [Acidobacteriota bacterium]
HFAAGLMLQAIQIYRESFRASVFGSTPYLILGVNIIAAETDDQARLLATSGRESFANLRRGMPTPLPPPNPAFEREVLPFGAIPLEEVQSVSFVGSPVTVKEGLDRFVERTQPDEVMVVAHIYDQAARLRSYAIAATL